MTPARPAQEELNARLVQAVRVKVQLLLADLDRADQTRVLLMLHAAIADTLEVLEASTEP